MDTPKTKTPLEELAGLFGIAPSYEDVWGKIQTTGEETYAALLKAMGADATGSEAIWREIQDIKNAAERSVVPDVEIIEADGPQIIKLTRIPEDRPLLRIEGESAGNCRFDEKQGTLRLEEPLPPGIHRASVEADFYPETLEDSFTLISAPGKGFTPDPVTRGEKLWGINLPLYAISSSRSMGIGDLEDLRIAVMEAASLGADMLGLLPLHALPNELPYGISPYYPWSRLWMNAIYLALDLIPEFNDPEVREFMESPGTKSWLADLRAAPLVDYEGVWKLKSGVLKLMFGKADKNCGRWEEFEDWRSLNGDALRGFTIFCALREHFASINGKPSHWEKWPGEFRRYDSPAVARFARENEDAVTFHAWLQWHVSSQFALVAEETGKSGMSVGLYLDLALGVDPAGPDAWMYQDLLALDASVGCPPDPFSLLGQEWGLPPLHPVAHRKSGYLLAERTLNANMKNVGAMRLDHAASLARLFWVPRGKKPADGAYVEYAIDEQLALLRALSARHRCLVIGEDLGTVPATVKEGLEKSGFYSYKLLMFEKEWGGLFKAPFNFAKDALISFATHDLPTMDGWWTGRDLLVKTELKRYPDDEMKELEASTREEDIKRLIGALVWQKLLPEGYLFPEQPTEDDLTELAKGVHTYMARAESMVLMINLDDLVGSKEMQNLPGTVMEHPNWRRKIPHEIQTWAANRRLTEILAGVRAERGNSPRSGK